MTEAQLRHPFKRLQPLWLTSLLGALLLAIPRFVWMLQDKYSYIILLFVVMGSLPLIIINKSGRSQMGFIRPHFKWILVSFVFGAAAAITIYFVGLLVIAERENHWYYFIMNSFNKGDIIASIKPSVVLFLLFALPSMIFSPLGEEFFFRGFLHETWKQRWGSTPAHLADSLLFGITHLAHYGLFYKNSSLQLLPFSSLWVLLMMAVSVLFYFVRNRSGSIWSAVAAHAGFNLGMMACIVYLIH